MSAHEFDAELWVWDARPREVWTFVSLPVDDSAEIAELAETMPRAGFGAVRVEVTVGRTSWRTSVFPGGDGRYSLPIKAQVRRREGLEVGGPVHVELETLDF
jgi:hypothetical protein